MLNRIAFNWKAQTAHGLHSPFVYDLYTQVIDQIYQQKPMDLIESMIHGIGRHLQLAAGKLHVIDFRKLREAELAQIEEIMSDPSNLLICTYIHHSKETLQNWSFLASKQQAIHSIELIEMGIISLNPTAPKQYFRLKKS